MECEPEQEGLNKTRSLRDVIIAGAGGLLTVCGSAGFILNNKVIENLPSFHIAMTNARFRLMLYRLAEPLLMPNQISPIVERLKIEHSLILISGGVLVLGTSILLFREEISEQFV